MIVYGLFMILYEYNNGNHDNNDNKYTKDNNDNDKKLDKLMLNEIIYRMNY